MGKNKKQTALKHDAQHTFDQAFKKNQFNNVSDLITDKQRQIQKRRDRTKKKHIEDSEDQQQNSRNQHVYQIQDQQLQIPENRYQTRDERENKQKVLEIINRMIAKNKINSSNSFNLPLLNVRDFESNQSFYNGEYVWNKMSSILQNGYKVYGIRVDTTMDFISRMSSSLGRRQNGDEKMQNKEGNGSQTQKKKTIGEFESSEIKNDLGFYLEKNSDNLDLSNAKKLFTRKDPLFERTCRKFDLNAYSSFFLNTLKFNNNLLMKVNESEQNQQKRPQNQTSKDNQDFFDTQKYDQLQLTNEYEQNNLFEGKKSKSIFQKVKKLILQIQGFSSKDQFDQQKQKEQFNFDYEKKLNMFFAGQLNSAFENGNPKPDFNERKNIFEQKEDQQQINFLSSNTLQNINYEQEYNKLAQIDNGLQLIKSGKKIRKIKQVISLRDPNSNKKAPRKRPNYSRSKKNDHLIDGSEYQQFFNAEVYLKFKKILKQEKAVQVKNSLNFYEKNLLQVTLPTSFQIHYLTDLRPMATKKQLKKQLKISQSQITKGIKQNKFYENNAVEPLVQQIVQQNKQIEQQNEFESLRDGILNRKQPTITLVKQNAHAIIKNGAASSFKTLFQYYIQSYESISKSTLFIALLHLANQGFIKVQQKGTKDFKVRLKNF